MILSLYAVRIIRTGIEAQFWRYLQPGYDNAALIRWKRLRWLGHGSGFTKLRRSCPAGFGVCLARPGPFSNRIGIGVGL